MKKVRVTVLKKELYSDLVELYGAKTVKACPFFEEGQVYECAENKRPEGFGCEDAWACISRNVFALSSGGTDIYGGRWLKEGSSTCINCCNDGMRPVIFKLEAVD